MQFNIHELHEWDEAIAEIETAAVELPWSQANLASCFSPSYRVFGLYREPQPQLIGYLILHQPLADEWTIMNIVVAPAFQRQGIGTHLVDYVCQLAQQQGACIWLEVRESNQVAIRLYQRLGFMHRGSRNDYYPTATGQREAAVLMCWEPTHHGSR